MSSASEEEEDTLIDSTLFQIPTDYYKPPAPPTTTTYTLLNGHILHLRLVGQNPLWTHHIWQGAHSLSHFLQLPANAERYLKNKTVLELGAGAGLPSLVAAFGGARKVVCTDYPDGEVVGNLRGNVGRNLGGVEEEEEEGGDGDGVGGGIKKGRKVVVVVEGFLWGSDAGGVLGHLGGEGEEGGRGDEDEEEGKGKGKEENPPGPEKRPPPGFDTLLLADLLYNHSCHHALLTTILQTLARPSPLCPQSSSPTPSPPPYPSAALVFFTPYRPWLLEQDMAFFALCEANGLKVRKVWEERVGRVMFEGDRGDEEVRRRVLGFEVGF